MDIETANRNNKFDQFFDYFERTQFPVTDSDGAKYDFNLWNYSDKFNFKENKNQLIKKENQTNTYYFQIIMLKFQPFNEPMFGI